MLVARGAERLEETAAETGSEWEVCDVADREAVAAAVERIGERHEAVHMLVNNAGIPARMGFLDAPAERIEDVTGINYLGGVWCLRALLPLLERASPSHLVNVVSVAGTVPFGPSGPYAAAKHAQMAFSRNVTAELAPRGIKVHTIAPGPVVTEGFPQERTLAGPWRRVVIGPERVADAILSAVDRGRPETFVPPGFRLAAAASGIAPGVLTRLAVLKRLRG